MIGEFDRAIAEGIRAVELDPLSLIINADLGQDFMLARRYDEAIEQLRKTLAMDPRFYYARWTLGECLQMKGQLTEAMAEYQKAAEITDDPMVIGTPGARICKDWPTRQGIGPSLATRAAGRAAIRRAFHLRIGPSRPSVKTKRRLTILSEAYHERVDPGIVGIKVEPLLDPRGSTIRKTRQSNPAVKRASGGNVIDSRKIDRGSAL